MSVSSMRCSACLQSDSDATAAAQALAQVYTQGMLHEVQHQDTSLLRDLPLCYMTLLCSNPLLGKLALQQTAQALLHAMNTRELSS